jgi:hypothetical protein
MAFPMTLAEFRAEILDTLDEAIRELVEDLESSRAQMVYGLDDFKTVRWVLRSVQKSHSNMRFFFDGLHPISMADMPSCLDVLAYQFQVNNAGTSSYRLGNP